MNDINFSTVADFLAANSNKFRPLGQRNSTTRQILSLYNGSTRNGDNLVFLHGLWAHQKALEAGLKIHSFIICPSTAKWPVIADISLEFMRIAEQCYSVSERTFLRFDSYGDSDGILSIAELPMLKSVDLSLRNDSIVFVMDGLEKPGNVGVILRTCDGAGVDAVMICNLRTRVTHPNAIKASMGAAFTIPIAAFDDANSCKEWLLQNGFTLYIADPNSGYRYDKLRYSGKIAVVLGDEHKGPSKTWYDGSGSMLSIPMNGTCDSLNVSIAAAIIAYEIQSKKLEL